MQRIEVPVLIVGAGPTGLSAALLAQRLGVDHLLVERRDGPQRAPAAHCVNARTFEIWRQAGADMSAIVAASQDPVDAGFVYWVTRLGGEILGRLPYENQGDEVLAVTPTPLRNLSQHRLEPILLQSVAAAGAPAARYSHQWESARQDGDAVCSQIRALDSGETYEVRSRYLLAADGAGSPVRKWLGIEPVGPERIQAFVMIHFEADLRSVVRDCPGVLYWTCDPDAGGVLVAHDIDREWVYMHAWDPEREPREHYTDDVCERLVRRAVARTDLDLRIRTISTWMMTAQVAPRYREGRAFLLGDAAHRFPPTGGLGLNTGVQDAHNLIWKLAAVERGEAGGKLLDTYESERRPVAQINAEQSLQNAMRMMEVNDALARGDGPDAARTRFAAVLTGGDARRRLSTAIENQAEHFDMLGLQLGYSYDDGALVGDGTDKPPFGNRARDFTPNSRPGSRLPHGWVRFAEHSVSTLDLIAPSGFTLLAGPDGSAWLDAAGDDVRVMQLGRDVTDAEEWWTRVAGLGPAGVLLVRPDQHIAYRSRHGVADARQTLRQVLAAICFRGEG